MTAVIAEIASQQAAINFAEQTGHLPELDSLLEILDTAGISTGIEGRLKVWLLLSRLIGLGVRLDDAATLSAYLVPILAKSAHDQDEIRNLIEGWIRSGKADVPRTDDRERTGAQAVVPKQVKQLEHADKTGMVTAISFGVIALATIVAIATSRLFSGHSTTAIEAAGSVVTRSQPVLSVNLGLNAYWQPIIEDGLSRLGFAAVALVFGLTYAAWRHEAKARLVRRVGETNLVNTFAMAAESPGWFRTFDARTAFDRLKRVRWLDTDTIDVARTIVRTTRAGGQPMIVNQRLREPPNYVLLIDRAATEDHAGIFARAMEAALIDARIVYSRYDFSGSLDRLNPVRGGAQSDIVDAEYTPFSVIASRHAGERLILVGSGTGFFEVPGFRFDRAGRRTVVRPGTPLAALTHIREFSMANLVTSAPVSAWGENERRLANLGFAIFPADVSGIKDLAMQITSDPDAGPAAPPHTSSDDDLFLDRLDRDSMRFTSDIPPPDAEIARLVAGLKAWTGDQEVYTLLASIAAFPKIDPGFTFVLARLVLQSRAGTIDSELFGRLIRLPWIRDGYMPDWLRIGIVNGLLPQQRDLIRRIQATMMAQVESAQEDAGAPVLAQLVAKFEIARALSPRELEDVTSRVGRQNILTAEERIFFAVLNDEELDPVRDVIQPEAPEIVADRMEEPERRRRFALRAAVIGIAALAALMQPWISVLLETLGDAVDGFLGWAAGLLHKSQEVTTAASSVATVLILVAMARWLFDMLRAETPPSSPAGSLPRPLGRLLSNPRWPAMMAGLLFVLFLKPSLVDRASRIRVDVDGRMLLFAAMGVLAWVSVVTPQRWWNRTDTEAMLPQQLRRDFLTASLGTMAVFMLWALPCYLVLIPAVVNKSTSVASFFTAAFIGAAGWAASTALMRRWLLGGSQAARFERVLLDFASACLTFLVLNALHHFLLNVLPEWAHDASITAASLAAYYLTTRANLGLRSDSLIWRPVLDAILRATVIVTTLGIAVMYNNVGALTAFFWPELIIMLAINAFGIFVSGGTIFLAAKSLRSAGTGNPLRQLRLRDLLVSCALIVMLQAGYLSICFGYDFSNLAAPLASLTPEEFVSLKVTEMAVYGLVIVIFILPSVLPFWCFTRYLARSAGLDEREDAPAWRAVVDSPWIGTLAMWLTAIGWKLGALSFSVWPIALLVAVASAWRHGARATPAIVVGTLPMIVRIGDGDNIFLTPGGVWPALVVLFWVRFVTDHSFRQRLLCREELPAEAGLIAVILSIRTDFWLLPGVASIHVDPSWMAATVAFVVGSSRMPIHRFAIALAALWGAHLVLSILPGAASAPATSLGLDTGDFTTLLTTLYAARAWRRSAASGMSNNVKDPLTGQIDRRLVQMKAVGLNVSVSAVVFGTILASGWVPTVSLGRIDWKMVPSTAGTLALLLVCGLIAGNLWVARLPNTSSSESNFLVRWGARVFRVIPMLIFTIAYAPLYLLLASPLGPLRHTGIGVSNAEVIPFDLKAIGFATCCVVFFAFGAALRIAAERREGERWQEAARRLWNVETDASEISRRNGSVSQSGDGDRNYGSKVA